jgi:membrane associated rhomboid family serine protease
MGIHDRDYYRREGPSFLGTLASRAPVCKWLIAINIVVFLVQLVTIPRDPVTGVMQRDPLGQIEMGAFTRALDLEPDKIVEGGQVWRLFTHAFLHSFVWTHIVFNMLFLWWMGNELEEMYGSREFLFLYMASVLFAGACLTVHGLTMPHKIAGLGASGAVSALTMIFACHFPHRTVLLFFVIPMPIWLLAVIWFGWDFLVFIMGVQTQTGVAAHLGGALFGYLYYKNHWRLSSLFSGLGAWRKKRAKPRLRIYREEEPAAVVSTRAPAEHEIDEHFEAKLDAVLEKMNLVGKDNLTDHEKEILLKASEIYRRRRT